MRIEGTVFYDERDQEMVIRKDGRGLILASWIAFGLGAISLLALIFTPATDYAGNIDYESLQMRNLIFWSGAGLMSVWMGLFMTGCIVRALYFLPGDPMKPIAETLEVRWKTETRQRVMENDPAQ